MRRRRDPVLSSLLVLLLCVAVLEQIYGLDLRNHLSTFYKTGHNHHHSQVACVYYKPEYMARLSFRLLPHHLLFCYNMSHG